jgi:biotin carboxyl carrier protein
MTRRRWFLNHEARSATLDVERIGPERFRVRVEGRDEPVEVTLLGRAGATTVTANGRVFAFLPAPGALVTERGRARLELGARPRARASAAGEGGEGDRVVRAPMPGRVLKVLVAEGDGVNVGAPLIVVEAMKMENELSAARSGVVKGLRVKAGDAVERDTPLLEIE